MTTATAHRVAARGDVLAALTPPPIAPGTPALFMLAEARNALEAAQTDAAEQRDRAELAEAVAVGAAVGVVHASIDALDKTLCRLPNKVTGPQIDATLELLRQVREARMHLATLESSIENRAGRSMTADTFERPDLFALRRRGSSRKAWDHDRLTERVRHEVAARLAEGDLDSADYRTAVQAIDGYTAIARPSWRVTALKAAGVRFDDCCETVPGKLSVQVSDRPLTDVDE